MINTCALVLLVAVAASTAHSSSYGGLPVCEDPHLFNSTLAQQLLASSDMSVQAASVTVAIPLEVLWAYVGQIEQLPSWNSHFNTIAPTTEAVCAPLVGTFSNGQFIGPILPPNLNGPHNIIVYGCAPDDSMCELAWNYQLWEQGTPQSTFIVYGQQSFTFEREGNSTKSSTWERAFGSNVAEFSVQWTIGCQESLLGFISGMVCLERYYIESGNLDVSGVASFCTHFLP